MMNEVKTTHTCPFGHTCIKTTAEGIERCVLYLELKSVNNLTQEETTTSNCAMNWGVILQHETNARVFDVAKATTDFRNEMVKGQTESTAILAQVALMSNSNQKYLGKQ